MSMDDGPAIQFAALGDATRLRLIDRLLTEDMLSIAQLANGQPISRQAVRKHLAVLERAGLVKSRSVGREQHFLLRKAEIERVRLYLDRVAAQWDDALIRLKEFSENVP